MFNSWFSLIKQKVTVTLIKIDTVLLRIEKFELESIAKELDLFLKIFLVWVLCISIYIHIPSLNVPQPIFLILKYSFIAVLSVYKTIWYLLVTAFQIIYTYPETIDDFLLNFMNPDHWLLNLYAYYTYKLILLIEKTVLYLHDSYTWVMYLFILKTEILVYIMHENYTWSVYLIVNFLNEVFLRTLDILTISVLNVILIVLFILIGGVIPLLERKYLSLIQRRVGPKFVGYNGRLQFLADAMKLLLKELIYLHNINKFVVTILPIFVLSINVFLLLNVVFLNSITIVDNNYFIFFLILIEMVSVLFLTHLGFLVKNKYTTIASIRLLNGVIVFEIFTTAVYLYFYLFYNKLGLNSVLNSNPFINKILVFILNAPIFINFILILLKRVPYDIIEAETELIMGYSTEHSGFLSGALLLIEYTHIFLWSYFIVIFII